MRQDNLIRRRVKVCDVEVQVKDYVDNGRRAGIQGGWEIRKVLPGLNGV